MLSARISPSLRAQPKGVATQPDRASRHAITQAEDLQNSRVQSGRTLPRRGLSQRHRKIEEQ